MLLENAAEKKKGDNENLSAPPPSAGLVAQLHTESLRCPWISQALSFLFSKIFRCSAQERILSLNAEEMAWTCTTTILSSTFVSLFFTKPDFCFVLNP